MPVDPDHPSLSDLDLMKAVAVHDDEAALAGLIQRHAEKLSNYFRRSGVSMDDEDLTQEVFVRLWKARQRWQPSAQVTTWLYTLARNALIDRVRKANRVERLHSEVRKVTPDSTAPASGSAPDVGVALGALKDDLREAVVLVVCQGLKYREAAEVLAVPEGTVKSRVHEGLARLRTWFESDA